MPFGEYELSPSLIGLSLLHTAHPEAFQRLLVRASIPRYRDFTLAMCRSLGFASATADSTPSSGSLSLRVRASSRLASPATATRRFIMQKARRHRMTRLRPLVGAWFQELFHSPRRGAFHLSLTVLVHYRSHGSIKPCRMVPADSRRIPRAPRYSGSRWARRALRVRGSHPLRRAVPGPSPRLHARTVPVLLPRARPKGRRPVWAPPRSLATTGGITVVFSSWGY